MSILRVILLLVRALFQDRSQLALENLALRQQLAVLRHKAPRPRLCRADRAFWPTFRRVDSRYRATACYDLSRKADPGSCIKARTFLCSLLSSGSNT